MPACKCEPEIVSVPRLSTSWKATIWLLMFSLVVAIVVEVRSTYFLLQATSMLEANQLTIQQLQVERDQLVMERAQQAEAVKNLGVFIERVKARQK